MQDNDVQADIDRLLTLCSLTKIVLVVLKALLRVETLLDGGDVVLRKESLAGGFQEHDAIEHVLLEHEVLNSFLVVNEVKVLSHQIRLIVIDVLS